MSHKAKLQSCVSVVRLPKIWFLSQRSKLVLLVSAIGSWNHCSQNPFSILVQQSDTSLTYLKEKEKNPTLKSISLILLRIPPSQNCKVSVGHCKQSYSGIIFKEKHVWRFFMSVPVIPHQSQAQLKWSTKGLKQPGVTHWLLSHLSFGNDMLLNIHIQKNDKELCQVLRTCLNSESLHQLTY